MYNQNATDTLAAFERAFDEVKNQLFDQACGMGGEEGAGWAGGWGLGGGG